MSDTATAVLAASPPRVTPTVSQPIRVDWASWIEQFLAHETAMIESAANAGLNLAENAIPGGFMIKMFVGEKVVDQLIEQGIKVLDGVLASQPAITIDGSNALFAYVANMVNTTAPQLANWLGPKMDDLIKAGLAKVNVAI